MVERDLFGHPARPQLRPDRHQRRGLVQVFATELEAGEALEAIARVKRRRGYRDL
jgi:hypothetical protein